MHQFNQIGSVSGGGAAALTFGQGLRHPIAGRSFGTKANQSAARNFDLVTDLGVRIGSGEWFRGLVTCAALCYGTWSLAPAFQPIPGASPAPFDDAQFEASRQLAIAPLAYGADTGRRMAPTDAVEALAQSPERPILDLRATIGRGDGIASVLERAGVGSGEAGHVATLLAGVAAEIRPGTVIDLTLGRRPDRSVARPLDRLTFRARFDLRVEISRTGGALALTQIPIHVDESPLRIQGRVGASLYRSARDAGVPARAVESYIRALNTQVQVPAGIASDDRFDIIVEHRRAATGEIETGQLLYAGLVRSSGRSLQLMQWTLAGRTQWFEASGIGRQTGGGGMQMPVPGPITSNYGLRMHPILGYARMHRGLDFRAGMGSPIIAVADGIVARAGWAGGYGNQVRINHAGGLSTSYSHMSRIAGAPGPGDRQYRHDRTFDRPAPPFRDLSQRGYDQSALGPLRRPRPAHPRRARQLPQPAAHPARHAGRRSPGAGADRWGCHARHSLKRHSSESWNPTSFKAKRFQLSLE